MGPAHVPDRPVGAEPPAGDDQLGGGRVVLYDLPAAAELCVGVRRNQRHHDDACEGGGPDTQFQLHGLLFLAERCGRLNAYQRIAWQAMNRRSDSRTADR